MPIFPLERRRDIIVSSGRKSKTPFLFSRVVCRSRTRPAPVAMQLLYSANEVIIRTFVKRSRENAMMKTQSRLALEREMMNVVE